jgi:sensor c-di-GMP phosphodiesterase-like protein
VNNTRTTASVAAIGGSEHVADVADIETIRRALQAGEFFLVYQPIVALSDGRCVGGEALIRWRRGSTVTEAGDFIPQTERTPLSGTITYWVMDEIANELGLWLAENGDALIGINVPPEILGRGGIEYAANKSGLRALAKQLVFEVTERGVPDQLGLDALNSIPATGARVALDDMTLSGANLALLTRCHFDFVKIDRSLVAQLNGDSKRPQWLEGMAAVVGMSELQVIAEGIERQSQATALRDAGVQLAQGHLFAPPLAADEFKRYYAESRTYLPAQGPGL